MNERCLQYDFLTQAPSRLKITLDKSDQILLPVDAVQLLKRLINGLINHSSLVRLLNFLRELLSDLNHVILHITFQFFLFLLKLLTQLEILVQSHVELTP